MAQYNPAGVPGPIPRLFGMSLDSSKNARIIDISSAAWTGTVAGGGPFANAGPVLSAVQFSNSMVFALGINVAPQLYDPVRSGSITPIANTFQSGTNYPPWLASTSYPLGAKIIGTATDTNSYIFKVTDPGLSGTTAPAFPPAYHAKIGDNGVIWENIGLSATSPTGCAFVFNHLNSLWIWGTAAQYSTTGPNAAIDGPDALRMSDFGNPTSFDPSNSSFIGLGDGQAPMGGAVWSQLEVGIPASPQLVLFKTQSTYSVIGAYPNVSISAIPDGVGCAAPSTVQLVPGIGIMRMSFFGVAVFGGTRDVVDQFTDPIRPYLFNEEPDVVGDPITPVDWTQIQRATATQTLSPPGYLMLVPLVGSGGVLTRAFFFDRLLRAWSVIDFPANLQLSGAYFNLANQTDVQTLVSGYADGVIRELFDSDERWDTDVASGTLVQWNFQYPVVGSPATPLYYRRGLFRASLLGSAANLRSVTLLHQDQNGLATAESALLPFDAHYLSASVDIDRTQLGGLLFHLFGQGRMLAQGLEVQYQPKPPGRIPSFV
jgi:hypothetical protein